MSLIAGLSEDLDGTFSIESNNGTTIRISFVTAATVVPQKRASRQSELLRSLTTNPVASDFAKNEPSTMPIEIFDEIR